MHKVIFMLLGLSHLAVDCIYLYEVHSVWGFCDVSNE